MRRAVVVALVLVAGVGASWAQMSPDQIVAEDLAIQRDIAASTRWMMWTGIASAVFAFLGFVGVMMTLREQRHLTVSQEAVDVRVLAIALLPPTKSGEGINLAVDLRSVGRTPAKNLALKVTVLHPTRVAGDDISEELRRIFRPSRSKTYLSGVLDDLEPGREVTLATTSSGYESVKPKSKPEVRYYGEPAHLVDLEFVYRDVFSRRFARTWRFKYADSHISAGRRLEVWRDGVWADPDLVTF